MKRWAMKSQFDQESFDSIYDSWKKLCDNSKTAPIFSSPEWSRVWWQQFGSQAKLYLGAAREGSKTIGIAPLQVNDDVASFIGGSDVCDYLDFVVEPGSEDVFFSQLLDNLKARGIKRLELNPLRPDSTARTSLINAATKYKWRAACSQEDVTVELNLPPTWEEYLKLLSGKQRHELNR